mgnify:CR=1 FL=1
MNKDDDLKRLEEIAILTDRKTGIFAERREIWRRRLEAGYVTQAELARRSRVQRGDVKKGISHE